MTPSETAELLTLMAAYDRRTIGAADVAAWHREVATLPLGDCQDAVVAHYGSSREWVMPADVLNGVRALRADRLRMAGDPPIPPVDGDDVPAYLAWIGKWREGIAAGLESAAAEDYADRELGIVRAAVEARPRPVAELIAAVARTSRMPARAAASGPTRHTPEDTP